LLLLQAAAAARTQTMTIGVAIEIRRMFDHDTSPRTPQRVRKWSCDPDNMAG